MSEEFAAQGIDKIVPRDLTVRLEEFPETILLLQGEVSQRPSEALIRVRDKVEEYSQALFESP